jgi:hypothetical protein
MPEISAVSELPGQLLPCLLHEKQVHLVGQEAVDLEDATAQVSSIAPDALFQLIHALPPAAVCRTLARRKRQRESTC